jgi:hypothetical protein
MAVLLGGTENWQWGVFVWKQPVKLHCMDWCGFARPRSFLLYRIQTAERYFNILEFASHIIIFLFIVLLLLLLTRKGSQIIHCSG